MTDLSSICWPLPLLATAARADPGKVKSLELKPGPPYGSESKAPDTWPTICCLFGHVDRKLDWNQRRQDLSRPAPMGHRCPGWQTNRYTTVPPQDERA